MLIQRDAQFNYKLAQGGEDLARERKTLREMGEEGEARYWHEYFAPWFADGSGDQPNRSSKK
jgi:hypothetical protein